MDKELAVKRITLVALLATLSMVIKIVFQLTTTSAFRFTLYEIPLIICGIAAGPIAGLTAGFVSDFVYASAYGYPLGIFTISAMMWGFIAGLLLYQKRITWRKIIIAVILASVLEFTINSTGLFVREYAGDFGIAVKTISAGMPIRIIISLIKWPVQIFLIHLIWIRLVDSNILVPHLKKR